MPKLKIQKSEKQKRYLNKKENITTPNKLPLGKQIKP